MDEDETLIKGKDLKEFIRRDGLYLIGMGICVLALIFMAVHEQSLVNDCNEKWISNIESYCAGASLNTESAPIIDPETMAILAAVTGD